MNLLHRLEAAPWLYGTLAVIVLAGAVGTDRAAAAGATTSESARAVRTLGRADAPATILEFTDLQCPYCAQFALETLPLLKQRYVDKGLLRIVSYDLPLNLHAYALPAAVAARCAGEQGHFWDYRDALFRGQAHLATAPYDQLARHFGMDVARFSACRDDPQQASLVMIDAGKAASKGIFSTPTFVIGRLVNGEFVGEILTGAQPIAVFEERLEKLLQQTQQPASR